MAPTDWLTNSKGAGDVDSTPCPELEQALANQAGLR